MAFPEIFGHNEVRADLARAHAAGRLPQVLLVTGEPGVGKQQLGLWLAQLVLCGGQGTKPCGSCRACRLVRDLSHPDFHWFVPLPRPKASDPDKQLEEVREALGEVMAARRTDPVYPRPDGMAMHGVASARLILKTASLTTVEGGRRVIIIGEADRLVPQEASQEAANALLKFLEEPPASALIVLTTTEVTRVLPTIRSRAVPIRLGRLDRATIDAALTTLAPKQTPAERQASLAAAEGSIGRALTSGTAKSRSDDVDQLLEAIRQGGAARFERVLRQGPWQARGEFSDLLDGLSVALGQATRALTTPASPASVPESLKAIKEPSRLLSAQHSVDQAREKARGNINPQLLLATLTGELAEALWA